jgi:hypothetical protein
MLVKSSDDSAAGHPGGRISEARRRQREAVALRQNLLKRKSQQRGRLDQPSAERVQGSGESSGKSTEKSGS